MRNKFKSEMFMEGNGREIFAVNANNHTLFEAKKLATEEFGSTAQYTDEYTFLYYGFGQVNGKQHNCYWITNEGASNRMPVYCFVKEK